MRKSFTAVLALAICGVLAVTGLALAATAAKSKPAKTTVTIKGRNGDFNGTVTSPKLNKCANNRDITVYKQKGKKQHPSSDSAIGSDTSQLQGGKGVWSIGNSGYKSGKFYARASSKPGCKGGSSKTITEVAVP